MSYFWFLYNINGYVSILVLIQHMLKMALKAIILTLTPNPNSNVCCEKIERKKKKAKQLSLPLFWFVAILYRIQYMLKVALKVIILTLAPNTNSYVCCKMIEENKNKKQLPLPLFRYVSSLVPIQHMLKVALKTKILTLASNTNSYVGCKTIEGKKQLPLHLFWYVYILVLI
jgi:hypothetical protein